MIRPGVQLGSKFTVSSIPFCRAHSSFSEWKFIQELEDGKLHTFCCKAFAPSKPALLPRGHFYGLPAMHKWFTESKVDGVGSFLNHTYLDSFGTAMVPLELTRLKSATLQEEAQTSFQRAEAPLEIFLEWTKQATMETTERFYLAQASLASLPQGMTDDLPTPELVAKAGTGDVYDANIWMGIAPTYTPLHRDPNPNLFVQLAGHKIVRMLPPDAGDIVFARMQSTLGKSGCAQFRGDEMMKGEEKKLLEAEVWDDMSPYIGTRDEGYEAHVWPGDGIFIPKGWWHSIKGVDGGVLGSANWWFR